MNLLNRYLGHAPQSEPAIGAETPAQPARLARHRGRDALRHTPTSSSPRSRTAGCGGTQWVDQNPANVPPSPAAPVRAFAEHTLRIALEVLDQKRPADHLKSLLDQTSLSSIRTLARSSALPGRELGAARLDRVGVQMLDPDTAEVFGCYRRGTRRLAFAARATRSPRTPRSTVAASWQLTAFRIM